MLTARLEPAWDYFEILNQAYLEMMIPAANKVMIPD